jgi:hypothetical protein
MTDSAPRSLLIPYIEMVDPRRAKDRRLSIEPQFMKSRMLKLLPSFAMPYNEKVDPHLAKLRTESDEPK